MMPSTLTEVPAALAGLVTEWGFDGGFYVSGPALIDKAGKKVTWQDKPLMVAALPPELGRIYLAEFLGRDPMIERVVLAESAVYWDKDVLGGDFVTGAGPLLKAFGAVGLDRGLSIPVYRNGRLGYFNYLSRLPAPRFGELLSRSLRTLTMVAVGLHQTVQAVLDESEIVKLHGTVRPLSEREAEMLTWSARGKTVAETAIILSISEKTVQFHLSNCLRKLGAANKVEAAIRAIGLGWVRA
ncbi:MAG: autoinducer binding domain-containing protein [Magnetospirillum sp.]|nr:autoinducer binding domain-containing protein [Magnetospirillum sp.]